MEFSLPVNSQILLFLSLCMLSHIQWCIQEVQPLARAPPSQQLAASQLISRRHSATGSQQTHTSEESINDLLLDVLQQFQPPGQPIRQVSGNQNQLLLAPLTQQASQQNQASMEVQCARESTAVPDQRRVSAAARRITHDQAQQADADHVQRQGAAAATHAMPVTAQVRDAGTRVVSSQAEATVHHGTRVGTSTSWQHINSCPNKNENRLYERQPDLLYPTARILGMTLSSKVLLRMQEVQPRPRTPPLQHLAANQQISLRPSAPGSHDTDTSEDSINDLLLDVLQQFRPPRQPIRQTSSTQTQLLSAAPAQQASQQGQAALGTQSEHLDPSAPEQPRVPAAARRTTCDQAEQADADHAQHGEAAAAAPDRPPITQARDAGVGVVSSQAEATVHRDAQVKEAAV